MAWCIVCSNTVLSLNNRERWLWSVDPRDGSEYCVGVFNVDICSVCDERWKKTDRNPKEDRRE